MSATLGGWLDTYVDCRIGGVPRWVVARDDRFLMQIPNEVRKCAVFLHADVGGQRRAQGTAFFLSVPFSDDPDRNHVYLVTAKHVIDGMRAWSDDGIVYIRMNRVAGDAAWAACGVDQWINHPDEFNQLVDVAVLPWAPPPGQVDFLHFPSLGFATADKITANEIGLGDEVFMTGLFVGHSGRRRNIPIVRVGNIAAIPEEPVQTKLGSMDSAYLIEARSVGGLSGSPVFVTVGPVRTFGNRTAMGDRIFYLLGLMHGHWQVPFEADEAVSDALTPHEYVNMGIAIVVSIDKIIEVLDQPKLKEQRKRNEKLVRDMQPVQPVADTLVPVESREAEQQPPTRTDFLRDLRKIKKQPEQR